MRVLAVERDIKACNYYRILTPLSKLEEHGYMDVVLLDFGTRLDSEEASAKVFEADIIVIPRPSSEEWFGFVQAARKAGKVIISDYDDDPLTCSPLNPYYRWIGVEEWNHPEFGWVWKHGMKGKDGEEWFNIERNIDRRNMMRATFKNSDLVTVTTKELQKAFKKVNENTIVLPNCIDPDYYPRGEMIKKKIRIGWQGGVSHYEDLHFIKPVLEEISKRDDVEIVYFGDFRLAKSFTNVKGLQFQNWVDHRTYPFKLKLLNFDIGLCPLVDNVFNRCKSAIKYFEYTMVGAATVASNIPPYSDIITNGKDGLLCGADIKEWVEAINSLCDREKTKQLAKAAYENVMENHTINKNVHKWADAYNNVVKSNMELIGV